MAFSGQSSRIAELFHANDTPKGKSSLTAHSVDKGHGRIEKRTIRLTSILTKAQEFKGLKQGFELKRERTSNGKTSVEVVHGITSLSRERADAERMLEFTREHWSIENGLHYRRDVTLGEDQSRIRKGVAPQVMAGLRNSIVHLLLEEVEAPSLAAAVRTMSNCPDQALKLLGLTECD